MAAAVAGRARLTSTPDPRTKREAMPAPPERFKTLEELSPDEHIAYRETGRLPESDAYRDRRREVLEAAGLDADDPAEPDLESMSPADHDRRRYGATGSNR